MLRPATKVLLVIILLLEQHALIVGEVAFDEFGEGG